MLNTIADTTCTCREYPHVQHEPDCPLSGYEAEDEVPDGGYGDVPLCEGCEEPTCRGGCAPSVPRDAE